MSINSWIADLLAPSVVYKYIYFQSVVRDGRVVGTYRRPRTRHPRLNGGFFPFRFFSFFLFSFIHVHRNARVYHNVPADVARVLLGETVIYRVLCSSDFARPPATILLYATPEMIINYTGRILYYHAQNPTSVLVPEYEDFRENLHPVRDQSSVAAEIPIDFFPATIILIG